MYQDIAQLHEEVLMFLLRKREQNPDLCFTLRKTDGKDGKLKAKNWFYGSEKEIYFSFWDCMFQRVNSSKMYIELNISLKSGNLSLVLNTGNSVKINEFTNQLAHSIGIEHLISRSKQKVFKKEYGYWKEGLDSFLQGAKIWIDSFLEQQLIEHKAEKIDTQIGFLAPLKFENSLKIIDQYRNLTPINNNRITYKPNPAIKLKSINLENIGHFSSIELDLSKQVTILIGENGSGKSTILRAIALGITGIDFFDLDKDLQREKNKVFNGLLKINEYRKSRVQYVESGEINLVVDDENLGLKFSPSKLYSDKVEAEEIASNRNSILHEGKYIKTLVIGFSQSEKESVGRQFYSKNETKPSVTDLFPLISNTSQDILSGLVEWIYYYVHEKEDTQPVDKLFEIFTKITSEEVSIKRPYNMEGVVGSPKGEKSIIVCTPDSPNGIHLDLVSQGYKNLFRWVGGILMKVYEYQQEFFPKKKLAEISGIVLIDEIDTYLHPKWQRNILKVLVEEFPKLQFVVTTHSPLVIRSLDKEKIEWAFQVIDNNMSISEQERKNNYQPYSALLNVENEILFEIPQREPEITEALNDIFLKITKLNKTNLQKELEENEITNAIEYLKKRLNANDPDIVRAEIALRTKKTNLQYADN